MSLLFRLAFVISDVAHCEQFVLIDPVVERHENPAIFILTVLQRLFHTIAKAEPFFRIIRPGPIPLPMAVRISNSHQGLPSSVIFRDVMNTQQAVSVALDETIRFEVLTTAIAIIWSAKNSIALQVLSDKCLELVNANSIDLVHAQLHLSRDSAS